MINVFNILIISKISNIACIMYKTYIYTLYSQSICSKSLHMQQAKVFLSHDIKFHSLISNGDQYFHYHTPRGVLKGPLLMTSISVKVSVLVILFVSMVMQELDLYTNMLL